MIPQHWSPGVKWFGLRWPPQAWWFGGTLLTNHPVAHLAGGILLAVVLLWGGLPDRAVLALAAVLGGFHEALQVEYWSERGGYPLYSAIFDALFVVLGAVVPLLAMRFL